MIACLLPVDCLSPYSETLVTPLDWQSFRLDSASARPGFSYRHTDIRRFVTGACIKWDDRAFMDLEMGLHALKISFSEVIFAVETTSFHLESQSRPFLPHSPSLPPSLPPVVTDLDLTSSRFPDLFRGKGFFPSLFCFEFYDGIFNSASSWSDVLKRAN